MHKSDSSDHIFMSGELPIATHDVYTAMNAVRDVKALFEIDKRYQHGGNIEHVRQVTRMKN